MELFVVIAWFLCGILGVYLANASDRKKQIPLTPDSAFFVIAGPVTLLGVLIGICGEAI